MITYAEARDIALLYVSANWGDTSGTPYVDDHGFEDDLGFMVPWGASEAIIDGDESFALRSDVVLFVSRFTGDLQTLSASGEAARIEAMTEVVATR